MSSNALLGCDIILKRLGCEKSFLQLNDDDRLKLQPLLLKLQNLVGQFPEDEFNKYVILDWAMIFASEQHLDIQQIFPKIIRKFDKLAKITDESMNWAYLGFNFIGLMLALAGFQNTHLGFLSAETTVDAMATHWNYLDTIGGWVTAIQQFQNGQTVAGGANMLSACQLGICTIIANIAYHSDLIEASTATVVGLMGFSFAAGMVIACGIELYEIKKCNDNIAVLENKLKEKRDIPLDQKTADDIRHAIHIEKAKKADHIRSAKSWAGCAIAMTAIAIVAYITLSGITFGALPAATVAVAAVAVVSGLIRRWWVNRVKNVDLLTRSYGMDVNLQKEKEIKPGPKGFSDKIPLADLQTQKASRQSNTK